MFLLASLTVVNCLPPSLSFLEIKCLPTDRFQTRKSKLFMCGFYKEPKKTRMKRKWAFILMTSVAAAFGSCYYDSFEALHPVEGYVNPCDSSLQSTYNSSIKYIISYNCISCHNSSYAAGNVILETYDQVKSYGINGKLMNSILRNSGYNPMPPTQPLAECQVQRIQEWIANNYPE